MLQKLNYYNWQKVYNLTKSNQVNDALLFRNEFLHRKKDMAQNFLFRPFKRDSREILPVKKSIVPTPFEGLKVDSGPVPRGNLRKATFFTIAFSVGTFAGVSIWEYESIRSKLKERKNLANFNFSWYSTRMNQRKNGFTSEWRREVDTWWNRLSPGERVFVPICALNALVFCMWRSKTLQPTMIKYFCSNPASRAVCWPMFLSAFSHYSLFHIFANMYVLHSFSNVAVNALGKEQFLGLYLTAGVVSSLGSYIYKSAIGQAGLSLGASGAIMAILAFVCCEYPDTQLSILFLPMYTFSAGIAIKAIMGLDLAGILLGWKVFDHAAHLGGALFGLFWCYVGKTTLWPQREYFLRGYHQLRGPKV